MVTKLVFVLWLGILGILLMGCTMTISFDSLEAGSTTSSSWSKNSSSSQISRAGIDLATSQGQSAVLNENVPRGLKRALNRYASK